MATLQEFCQIVLESIPADVKTKESEFIATLTTMKQIAEDGKLDLEEGHKVKFNGFCRTAVLDEIKTSLSKYQKEQWTRDMMKRIT